MATVQRPLYFVMHMARLAGDAERVAHLMETKYKTDILLDNKILISHSIKREAQLLRGFPLLFRGMIEAAALIQPKDFFGNKYQGFDSYDYIELIVSFDYRTFSSIRFLGKDKQGNPIRFSFYGLPNHDTTERDGGAFDHARDGLGHPTIGDAARIADGEVLAVAGLEVGHYAASLSEDESRQASARCATYLS